MTAWSSRQQKRKVRYVLVYEELALLIPSSLYYGLGKYSKSLLSTSLSVAVLELHYPSIPTFLRLEPLPQHYKYELYVKNHH